MPDDTAQLETFYRMVAFFCLSAILLLVSFVFIKFKDRISNWT